MKWRDDTAVTTSTVFAFAIALGVANIALPLLALDSGYGAVAIGALTATSAAAQLVIRATFGVVARRFADRLLIIAALALLAISCGLLAVSTTVWVFVLAELCQGAARAYFWTGSQLHVMRGDSALRGIASVNLVSGLGGLLGPILSGALTEHSPATAVLTAAAIAAAGLAASTGLRHHPPIADGRRPKAHTLWRRRSVLSGCWASASAGAWSGLLTSYVPVILVHAGHPAVLVGVLVGCANGANIVGSYVVGRVPLGRLTRGYIPLAVAAGASAALLSVVAARPVLAAAVLLAGGLGAGALLTLGPVLAADQLNAGQRPDALAATGTFRASALLLSPLTVAGISTLFATGLAVTVVGAMMISAAFGRPAPEAGRQ